MAMTPSTGAASEAISGRSGFSFGTCNPDARSEAGPDKSGPTCGVRYGFMGYVGEFKYAPGVLTGCGSKVIIQTSRGIEIGEQISLTCGGCENSINRQQMLDYVKNCEAPEFMQPRAGRVLRTATPQDLVEDARIRQDAREKLGRAKSLAASMGLDMKIIACEHLFGGERIVFHFMSENRVDFRELVRDLAHEYHTRIEMHQVGARDEARLIADYEMCGRECCCKNFLKKLRPVTMRMAKLQKATLDPSKVSGRCGRLRCCLRYEFDGYDDLNKRLPRVGSRVRTAAGVGTVKDRQLLTQLLMIVYDGREVAEAVPVEEVIERNLPKLPPAEGPPTGRADAEPSAAQPAQRRAMRYPSRPAPAGRQIGSRTEGRPAGNTTAADEPASALPAAEEAVERTTPPADQPGDQSKLPRRRGRRGRRRRRRSRDGSSGENAPAGRSEPNAGGDRSSS